jgi:nicotinamidase/pyrazinamidase
MPSNIIQPSAGDSLLILDVQQDIDSLEYQTHFENQNVNESLNTAINVFDSIGLPIFVTRDRPTSPSQTSRKSKPSLPHQLPASSDILLKNLATAAEVQSGFHGTELQQQLKKAGINRIFLGGIASDHCVLNTIREALGLGYRICFLEDATKAISKESQDEKQIQLEMAQLGVDQVQTNMLRINFLKAA